MVCSTIVLMLYGSLYIRQREWPCLLNLKMLFLHPTYYYYSLGTFRRPVLSAALLGYEIIFIPFHLLLW